MILLLFSLIISVFGILSRGISQKKDMISIYFNLFIIRKRCIILSSPSFPIWIFNLKRQETSDRFVLTAFLTCPEIQSIFSELSRKKDREKRFPAVSLRSVQETLQSVQNISTVSRLPALTIKSFSIILKSRRKKCRTKL